MGTTTSLSSRADARLNRDRLLSAAREVLAEKGLKAEVSHIAERAGVGTGTVYRNYESKEALMLEVAREMAHRTSAELLEIAAKERDARRAVAKTMQVGFNRVKEYGLLAIEFVAGNVPAPYQGVVNRQTLSNIFSILIRRGIDQGVFRADLDVEYAVAVWFALVAPHALSELTQKRSVDGVAELTTDFFLAGITAPGVEPLVHDNREEA